MTREEFELRLEALRQITFEFRGSTYVVTLERKGDGSEAVYFGEEYMAQTKYENFNHLMADCEIGYSYLREIIKSLEL